MRPLALLLVAGTVALAAAAGAEAGAAHALSDSLTAAQSDAARGDYSDALGLDRAIASRDGPLFILATPTVHTAAAAIPIATTQWAAQLAGNGHVEQAVQLLDTVSGSDASRVRILLQAARSEHSAHDDVSAIAHLKAILATAAPADVRAEASALLPACQTGEAAALVAAGRAADAVALLDDAAPGGGAAIRAALPATLLAAARQSVAADSFVEAKAFLDRITAQYPSDPAAAAGRGMLAAPQPVAGTLSTAAGVPLSGQIRLSSHFQGEPAGYVTSGPFYYGTADASGNFRFAAIPVGGPYILEVLRPSGWTTLVDPATGRPGNPVTVSPLRVTDLGFIILPG